MGHKGRGVVVGAVVAVVALAAPVLAAPAEVDATFGEDGVTTVALHEGDGITFHVSDVAVASDGSVVVLGGILRDDLLTDVAGGAFDLALARLDPDGRLDTSFGTAGVARLDAGGFDLPARAALDGQGRVLFSANLLGTETETQAVLGRLTAGGMLDQSFGEDGLVRFADAPMVFAGDVVVDAVDRPLVAVLSADGDTDASAQAEVRRLTVEGAPDVGFGTDGTATIVPSGAGALALAPTPGGGYVAGGVAAGQHPFVALLGSAGDLVPTFGDGGVAVLDLPGGAALAVQSLADGSIVAGGSVGARTGFIARLDAAGTPEADFGAGGVRTVRGHGAAPMPVMGLGLGPSGSVTFTGPQVDGSPQATAGRVLASGLEDAGFGGDGYVHPLADADAAASAASALATATDGRMVVAGIAASDTTIEAFASRLLNVPVGAAVSGGDVRRAAGSDRILTAIDLSRRLFPDTGTTARRAASVVIAAADRFPDALVAAPYAASTGGPLLLNPTDRLDDRVRAELARLLPDGGFVTLMGGHGAIGIGVETELRGAGYDIDRIAGVDRYETSVAVAERMATSAAVLARGDAFPDALAAGPAAAELGGAVLLTAGDQLPDSVRSYLDGDPDLARYAVGGRAAAAVPSAEPIVGTDRYDTAARVAERFFRTPPRPVVASGERFPDALAGGAYAALTGSPLLLATHTSLPSGAARALRGFADFERMVVLAGGTAVLDDTVRTAVRDAAG